MIQRVGIVDLPIYIDTRFESKKKILYMCRSTISKSSYKICVLCQKGGTYFSKAKKNMCRKTKLMERDQKLDPYYQNTLTW